MVKIEKAEEILVTHMSFLSVKFISWWDHIMELLLGSI